MTKLNRLIFIIFSCQIFFFNKANATVTVDGKVVSPNIIESTQIDSPGAYHHFCWDDACLGNSAAARNANYLNEITTFVRDGVYGSFEDFFNSYNTKIADKYPEYKLDQAFSQSNKTAIEQNLFSSYDNSTKQFGPAEVINPVSTPTELLYSQLLEEYNLALDNAKSFAGIIEPEELRSHSANIKKILNELKKNMKLGTKIGSCLSFSDPKNKGKHNIQCEKLSPEAWEQKFKIQEDAAERAIAEAIAIQAALEAEPVVADDKMQIIKTQSDDPIINCYQEVLLFLERAGITKPSFVFDSSLALFEAMIGPNKTPKSKQNFFQIGKLVRVSDKIKWYDIKKPRSVYCENIKYYIFTKNGKHYALINRVEKPRISQSQKMDLVDYKKLKSYWSEVWVPSFEGTTLANLNTTKSQSSENSK